MDPPSRPAEHQIHSPESVRYKGAESSHQGVDLWTSIFRALGLHVGVYLETVRREAGEMGLVCRGCVLAVEVIFLPVLDMTRQNRFWKKRALAALQSNTSTFEKWATSMLRLGVTVEEF